MPTSRTNTISGWQTSSNFYELAHQYGLESSEYTYEESRDFYTLAGPGTNPYFLFAGLYNNASFTNGGWRGGYWSASSNGDANQAHLLRFDWGVSYGSGGIS